jgi:hypothetical protein
MSDFSFEPEAHLYKLDGQYVPSITQVIRAVRVVRPDGTMSAWMNYDFLSEQKGQDSRDRGTWVADLCATRLTRDMPFPPALLEQIRAEAPEWYEFYRPFEPWLQRELAMGFCPMLVERPMVSRRHHFAGRPDIVCVRQGNRPAIVEVKTGISLPETGIQLAAQALLVEEQEDYPYATQLHDRFALQLTNDGSEAKLIPHRDHGHDRALFLSALMLWQAHNGK